MNNYPKFGDLYEDVENEVFIENLLEIYYSKLFIFKNFSKRIFQKEYIFDYIFIIKYIVDFIINISLLLSDLFDDCYKYSFKSGIFKQSYFLLFIRYKKRNSNWYSLLYL